MEVNCFLYTHAEGAKPPWVSFMRRYPTDTQHLIYKLPKSPWDFFFFKKFIFQDDFSFFWTEYFPISVVLKLVIHKNLDWIESNISRFFLEKVDSFTLEFSNFLLFNDLSLMGSVQIRKIDNGPEIAKPINVLKAIILILLASSANECRKVNLSIFLSRFE